MKSNCTFRFDFWLILKGQIRGHTNFSGFISCKGAKSRHVLLLNTNRKTYMGSPAAAPRDLVSSDFDLKITQILKTYISYTRRVSPYVTIKQW